MDLKIIIEWIIIACVVLGTFYICVSFGVSASSIKVPDAEKKQAQAKYKTVQEMRDEFNDEAV